jgi:hypothetical protein
MGVTPKRYKVKLNSVEKVEELLQETYNQACQQIVTIQEVIIVAKSKINDEKVEE